MIRYTTKLMHFIVILLSIIQITKGCSSRWPNIVDNWDYNECIRINGKPVCNDQNQTQYSRFLG